MKKVLPSVVIIITIMILSSLSSQAMTNAEKDIYNHKYYPQSVYNGGVNQSPQQDTHDFYVNPSNGNATVKVTDISLPGKNGFDLNITRIYNSMSSNLYEPYVAEIENYTPTQFYIVSGKKDFEERYTDDRPMNFGYNNSVCINRNYYNYSTDNSKYNNMDKFEFQSNDLRIENLFDNYTEAVELAETLNTANPDIDALNPSSSVGDYWADYHSFTVYQVKVDVYTPIETTGLLPDTGLERYSRLGAGWEFDFPYIEKRYGYDDEYEYLHYGDKGVWEIDLSSDEYLNGLIGYQLNDLIITADTTVSHDGKTSEYCVTEKNGVKSYFASDGRLLIQRDRYGNEIKFYHNTKSYKDTYGSTQRYPYLTDITDSAGRTVSFDYGNDYTTSGKTYKDITITVSDSYNSENTLTYIYRLSMLNGKSVDGETKEYVLSKVINPENKSTVYNYSAIESRVNFFNRNNGFRNTYSGNKIYALGNSYITPSNCHEISGVENYYAVLTFVTEPNGRYAGISYSRFLKNCTPQGSMVFCKAYQIYDDQHYEISQGINQHNYKYFINTSNEYDGYPQYRREDIIPEGLSFAVNDIVGNIYGDENELVTNTHTYCYMGIDDSRTILLNNTVSVAADFKTTVDYTYSTDNHLITNVSTRQYNSADEVEYMETNEAYTYDTNNYGDLILIVPNGDTNRSISYEYNSLYHYPTKKTYKQNADKIIVTEYIPTTDNKSVRQEIIYENGIQKKKTDYSYDTYGNIIQRKEHLGNQQEYVQTDYSYTSETYNGVNLVSETVRNVADNDSNLKDISVGYEYDWLSNVTKKTDGNENSTLYEYDSMSRLTKETAPDGSFYTYTHRMGGATVNVVDPIGTKRVYSYDGSGNIISEDINSEGNSIKSYQYDLFNNLTEEIVYSQNGSVFSRTNYSYDTLRRPLAKEIFDNTGTLVYKETYSYDITEDYRKETVTVVGGESNPSVVTSVYYDKYGNKIRTEVGNDFETYTSDYVGNITSVKSARANNEGWTETHQTAYDFMGNVVTETDEYDNVKQAEYDQLGRLIKSYDAKGYATEFTYDNLGRVTEQKTPFEEKNGTVYYSVKKVWYDNNGNIVKERVYTNAAGETEKYNEVKYNYDNCNRLVMTESNDGTNSNYVQNYYDAKGNLLRVYTGLHSPLTINGLDDVTVREDAEYAVMKYSYDKYGRLINTTDSLDKVETNTYDDKNGLLLSTTDRNGNTFNYTYDVSGKVKSKSLSDGTNAETTVYGLTGQPLSKQNDTATISYVYNDKGLIASETNSASGVVKTFTYDSAGNVLTMTVTRNGAVDMSQSYVYDKLNRLTSVSENGAVIASYSYDANSNRIQTTVTGGETTNYAYNIANMLTSQTTGDKLSEQYTYYLNGNQKSKLSNGQTTNYAYDSMNRLVAENDTEYTFDDFGNRLTMSDGEITTTYFYDLNNRLTESVEENGDVTTSNKFFYDDNGNQITKATMVNQPYTEGISGDYTISNTSDSFVALYEYNCYNQLVGVDTNGVVSNYAYAPDGLRYSKTVGGNTTTFVYDNANVVEEITADGTNKYYRGIEIIKNDDNLYYLYNGQGDVAFLIDADGTSVADYVFDAYGNQSEENAIYNPFGYRGEYTDSESGMIYLRARMYDAESGRFINEDPIRDGLNWYVYCRNNPVNYIDPLGLAPSVMEAALMADHVYNHNWDEPINNRRIYDVDGNYTGWRMIDMFTHGTSKIGVYVRGDGKDSLSTYTGPKEYVLSYKGTKPTSVEDWENNIQQFVGEYSEHLIKGMAYTGWFVDSKKDYEITFTGHSKGGGEAAVNAEFWNKNAIVFNPSVPDITWALVDDGYVKPYVVTNEILNYVLGEIPLGTTKYLKQQHNGWLPGTTILDRINNHGMEAVIDGLIQGGY